MRRIGALVLRHVYLFRKSWPRVISLAYYPTVTLIMWAFVTLHLAPSNNMLRDAPGLFIGAVLLWDILFRGQLGVSLSFFEEMYSRNMGPSAARPSPRRENGVGPEPLSWMSKRSPRGVSCSPSRMARPSPSTTKLPYWWPA